MPAEMIIIQPLPLFKKCCECGLEKPHTDFYRRVWRRGTRQGLTSLCRVCLTKRASCWQGKNRERVRAYNRKRSAVLGESLRSKQKESAKKYARQKILALKEYKRKNYHKVYAKDIVATAIKRGKMIKEPCVICGRTKVHGHHCDYRHPKSVIWLCPLHHRAWHRVFLTEDAV